MEKTEKEPLPNQPFFYDLLDGRIIEGIYEFDKWSSEGWPTWTIQGSVKLKTGEELDVKL